jgi:hypothetical protein
MTSIMRRASGTTAPRPAVPRWAALTLLASAQLMLVGGLDVPARCWLPRERGPPLVNTFHEIGGAAGVAVLSSAASAGLLAARPASGDFAHAFTIGAIGAAASVVIAAALVPAVLRKPATEPTHS